MSNDDSQRWRCAWTDGRERCWFPGAISGDTRGGGRWYCRFHHFCDDGVAGQRIIEQSRGYAAGQPVGRPPEPVPVPVYAPVQKAAPRLPYIDAEFSEQVEPEARG